MYKKLYSISLLALILLSLGSCLDDEKFTADGSARLTIRRDSVDLGTILGGELSGTDTLKLFNDNKDGLRLTRIALERGAASPFRVNVDGQPLDGGEGADFEVLGRDSLFVFLSCLAPDADSNEPKEVSDRLLITTEGGAQHVVTLVAQSQSVVRLAARTLRADTALDGTRPFQILDSLVVAEGATLTLRAGTRLLLHPGASIIVRGRLVSEGTAEQNVVIRGDRLGNMLSQIPYDRIPAQWGGITLASTSYGNELTYTDIHSGSYGLRLDSADVSRDKLIMNACTVHNVGADGIYARHCRLYARDCQITNAAGHCLNILGGHATFVHCTIAQFYPLVGGYGVALNFANCDGEIRLPLYALQMLNCIVTGRNDDDIMGEQSTRYTEDPFNYLFHHCLLGTPKVTDESQAAHFVNCRWEDDDKDHARAKNFSPEFNYDELTFIFQLDSLSHALGGADPAISRDYAPTDRSGYNRLLDGAPDIGCFERH